MVEKRLTATRIATLRTQGDYHDGGGLYLQVRVHKDGKATKSWLYRFTSPETGKERYMGLGSLDDVSLADARAARDAARAILRARRDPIEARRQEQQQARSDAARARAQSITFDQCAAAYFASHKAAWKNPKHRTQWVNSLATYASPVIGALPVASIDMGLVIQVLERDSLWLTKPETASRVRGRIEVVLDFAKARGYREGENPAQWKGGLEALLPKRSKVKSVKHLAALPYAELPALMRALSEQTSVAASALRFAILTAARTNEVLGATWDEIDEAEKVWTVPAERMKAGKEHTVPLSDMAMMELSKMRSIRMNDYIFPGERNSRPAESVMLVVLRKLGVSATVHGLRSSFRDWCGDETPFPREVVEAALAHAVENKTEAAYRRGTALEKRRALMQAWADFLSGGA
jgi:integrase